MDVARLNFSHGKHAEHGARFDLIRARAKPWASPSPSCRTCAVPRSARRDGAGGARVGRNHRARGRERRGRSHHRGRLRKPRSGRAAR
jgi:hypothetical protein